MNLYVYFILLYTIKIKFYLLFNKNDKIIYLFLHPNSGPQSSAKQLTNIAECYIKSK